MSIDAVAWALKLPVPPSPKLTLVAIGQYANEDGAAWPKIETIAADTSQSRATVKRRLKELEDAGLLSRIARYSPTGGRTSDEIRLRVDLKPSEVPAWSRGDSDAADDEEGGSNRADQGVQFEPPPGSLVNPLDESPVESDSQIGRAHV